MVTTIFLGIISIGILIFVHELGHFIFARAAGIRVEVFSIGWGKGLISFKWRETRIQLGWIPFGGYCKMAGDSPKDTLRGGSDEYYASSPFRRIMVAFGGPFFNYLFAVLLFIVIIMVGYEINTFPNRIVLAEPAETLGTTVTPAQRAGLQDGDVILAINGKEVDNWDDITELIVRNPLRTISMDIEREGRRLRLTAVPELDRETGRGLIGIHPWVEPVVEGVRPGEPAERAGIEPGDLVISVDGIAIRHHVDFYDAIEGKSWQDVPVVVERGGEMVELIIMPEKVDDYDSAGLFFRHVTYRTERYPFHIAVGRGFVKSLQGVQDTVRGVIMVFSGRIRARSAVAGPAKLIYLSGVIAREGFTYFLQVMSYISIAFFIMNLIPFPALDGSHIILSVYEIATRKKPNLDVVYKIQTFGFLFLIVVLIFVTMNDISSFIGR